MKHIEPVREAANRYIAKVEEKREKIKAKVDKLQESKQELETQIRQNVSLIADYEIDDKTTEADKLRKQNKGLREKLQEIVDEIESYQQLYDNAPTAFMKEYEAIDKEIAKAREVRQKQEQQLTKRIDELKLQIENETREIEKCRGAINLLGDDRHITDAAKDARRLMNGPDIVTPKQVTEPRGATITYGEGHHHSYADVNMNYNANVPRVD